MYQTLRVLGLLVLISLFSFFVPQKVFAVSIEISNSPSTISDSMFEVSVNVSGANDGTNYLRVDLYKEGASNYFGETYNGSDWYSGSDGLKYFPITIIDSTASAVLKAQVGNPTSTKYPGPGEYKLKIRRYTSSGSSSSNDSQTPVSVQITYQTPSPEPTKTPTSTPVPTQTASPTSTPTPKPTPTKTATPKPTVASTPTPEPEEESEVEATELPFYDLTSKEEEATNEPLVLGTKAENKTPLISIVFILLGTLLLGYGGYMLYNNKKHEENIQS